MPELFAGRYTYHEWAAAELFEATRYYVEQGGTLGGDFLDEVERGIAFILENPEGGPATGLSACEETNSHLSPISSRSSSYWIRCSTSSPMTSSFLRRRS